MFLHGYNRPFASKIVEYLNGQPLKIYSGAIPVTADGYGDGTAFAADLLATTNDCSFTIKGYYQIITDITSWNITPTATGTATWFALHNEVTGEVLIGEVGGIGSTADLIVNDISFESGVSVAVLGFDFDVQGA